MPGTSNVGQNIRELHAINDTPGRHRPNAQIIAIAESQARKAKGEAPKRSAFGTRPGPKKHLKPGK